MLRFALLFEVVKRLLIVEDEPGLARMYELAFSNTEAEVKVAYDGLEALHIAASFQPEVILLDIMMPRMSGFEFINEIRDHLHSKVLIIANSNLEQEQDEITAKDLGADAYLHKSAYRPTELPQILEDHVKHWNLQAAV